MLIFENEKVNKLKIKIKKKKFLLKLIFFFNLNKILSWGYNNLKLG